MKKIKVYMKTTKDVLELPIDFADTAAELGRRQGINAGCIYTAVCRGYKGWDHVEIEVDDEDS